MMKVSTHSEGNGYFSAEVDGVPLLGDRGGISLFRSRVEAREEAKRRVSMKLPDDLGIVLDSNGPKGRGASDDADHVSRKAEGAPFRMMKTEGGSDGLAR